MPQKEFDELINIVATLREKCPWDRKQTMASLRQMTIEETYELTEAITREDWNNIREELGDVLLHIVFYAKIASEKGKFSIEDVLRGLCSKLITRHPHIYAPQNLQPGLVSVKNEDDVKQNWEKLKLKEGKKSVLSGVPNSLPGMVKAMRLQEKAKQVGFDWKEKEDVWLKVQEETKELEEAVSKGAPEQQEEELGDLLFSVINYARFIKIDADAALGKANHKFITRFKNMEQMAADKGKNLTEMTLEEMDILWNQVKTIKKEE